MIDTKTENLLLCFAHCCASVVKGARDTNLKLGVEMERMTMELQYSLRSCIDLLIAHDQLLGEDERHRRINKLVNSSYAELADNAIALHEKWPTVMFLYNCWEVSE